MTRAASGLSACDIEADALLAVAVEINGGDLRAAFARLCSGIAPAEIEGEDFRSALSRAVATLIERTRPARIVTGGAS